MSNPDVIRAVLASKIDAISSLVKQRGWRPAPPLVTDGRDVLWTDGNRSLRIDLEVIESESREELLTFLDRARHGVKFEIRTPAQWQVRYAPNAVTVVLADALRPAD